MSTSAGVFVKVIVASSPSSTVSRPVLRSIVGIVLLPDDVPTVLLETRVNEGMNSFPVSVTVYVEFAGRSENVAVWPFVSVNSSYQYPLVRDVNVYSVSPIVYV